MTDYGKIKNRIRARLREFNKAGQESDERLFEEMVFCLCTPQSSAKSCFTAVTDLSRSGMLFKADQTAISKKLKGCVRFHNNKSKYIVAARQAFSDDTGKLKIKERLSRQEPLALREWLVRNIKGLGYKEAGHFLRNIGKGNNLAILDRHILRSMIRYHILHEIPKTLTQKTYLDIEDKFREFSQQMLIPMAELDLLFWYKETGEIFK